MLCQGLLNITLPIADEQFKASCPEPREFQGIDFLVNELEANDVFDLILSRLQLVVLDRYILHMTYTYSIY